MRSFFRSTEFRIFLTVWIIYIFFISNYGGNYMEDSVLRLTLAIVDNHSIVIDKYVFKGIEDNAFYNGHYYSGFAPGDSFLAIPVYLLFKPFSHFLPKSFHGFPNIQLNLIFLNIIATIFVSSLLSAILAVLLYKMLSHFSDNKFHKLLITFTFSFGTLFFIYSTSYSKDVLKTVFLFASFFILFNLKHKFFKKHKGLIFFLSGLFLGFSITMDYKMFIVLPFFIFYSWYCGRKKYFVYFFFGLIIPLIFLLLYDYLAFDNPFSTAYNYRGVKAMNHYKYGFMGMTHPNLERIYGLTFSPFRGFFFYMPIMVLSFIGIFLNFFQKNKEYNLEIWFTLLLFTVLFYYNASLVTAWDAGGGFGPRYMIPAIPFMMIPVIFIFSKIKTWIVALFSLVSFFVNFLGVLYGREALWAINRKSEYTIFNTYIPLLFKRGFTNYTFNLIIEKIYPIPIYLVNLFTLFCLLVIAVIIWRIWKD